MALTPQQIEAARKQIGFTSPTDNPGAANVARRRQLAAEYDAQQQQSKGFLQRTGEDLQKRGNAIMDTMKKTAEGKISPLETGVEVVGDVIGGAGDILGEALSPALKPVMEKIGETDIGKKAFQALQQGGEKYNQWKNSSEENTRVGEFLEGLGNIASVLPVTKAGQIGKQATEQVLKATEKAGAKAVPLAMKVGNQALEFGKDAKDYAFSQLTGMQPETLKTIMKNPEKFKTAELEGFRRATLAGKVKGALDERIEGLKGVGKEYETIRKSGQTAELPQGGYKQFLKDNFNLGVTEDNKIVRTKMSTPMTKQDVSAIEEFLEIFGNEQKFNADEFLNVRQSLDNIARFDTGKTDASRKIARKLRQFHDKAGKEQIDGLAELDARFAPEAEFLNKIKGEILDKDGNLSDTAINRIANITGTGKDQQLQRLKQIMPDIEEEAKILKALEDVEYAKGRTVGAYARGLIGGAGVVSGNIPLIVGAIATSPKVVVSMLIRYGAKIKKANSYVEGVIKKIQLGEKLMSEEKSFIQKAIEDTASLIGSGTTMGTINEITSD